MDCVLHRELESRPEVASLATRFVCLTLSPAVRPDFSQLAPIALTMCI